MKAVLLLLLAAVAARAHPVAQGSMEIDVQPGHVFLRLRVSNEQVFVATAFGSAEPANLDGAWTAHGAYLLSKIEVAADGAVLAGTLTKVEPPGDRTVKGFAKYELRYPLAAEPRELRCQQALLNEINYAPGNRWEATFVVRATAGEKVLREGALFSHREPLVIGLGAGANPRAGVFGAFLRLGIHHILEGWDHLLFMGALVLAVRRVRELIAVVTAFTVAHTLTLALSVLDLVRLSPRIVEPMIAASIVVVAAQNVVRPEQSRGMPRLVVAFCFGLFHGLGFAGGLLAAMPPGTSVAKALVAFSLGVEIGHEAVVLPIFVGGALLRGRLRELEVRERVSLWTMRMASVAIAACGCFYLVSALRDGV
jgi:hypothetical protein